VKWGGEILAHQPHIDRTEDLSPEVDPSRMGLGFKFGIDQRDKIPALNVLGVGQDFATEFEGDDPISIASDSDDLVVSSEDFVVHGCNYRLILPFVNTLAKLYF
jgi:hypothetical protein